MTAFALITGRSRVWFTSWRGKVGSTLTAAEVSGSLGDLGTFLPLTVALVQQVGLDLGTTLIATGIYNIASGLMFQCPMCVQPMKTIAAVALAAAGSATPLLLPEVMAAGIFVAGTVMLLGVSHLIELANWVTPPSVLRGLQVGVGVKLAMKGVDLAFRYKVSGHTAWRPAWGAEGLLLGLLGLVFLLLTTIAPYTGQQQSDWSAPPRNTYFDNLIARWFSSSSGTNTSSSSGSTQSGTPLEKRSERTAEVLTEPTAAKAGVVTTATASSQGASHSSWEDTDLERAPHAKGEEGQEDAEDSAPLLPAPGSGSGHADQAAVQDAGSTGRSLGDQAVVPCTAGLDPPRVPAALIVVLVGLLVAAGTHPEALSQLRLGPSTPHLAAPSLSHFKVGILRAGLPQLPLTTLNSVVAVTQLANQLFPERDSQRWRPRSVAISVGGMNLLGCWFGAMPVCHGSGGLAAQYKFGARYGTAPVVLGSVKLLLGLLFGSSLFTLLKYFPEGLLGAMLTLAGVELASVMRHETGGARGHTFLLLTACGVLTLDTALGFLLGWSAVVLVAVSEAVGTRLQRAKQ